MTVKELIEELNKVPSHYMVYARGGVIKCDTDGEKYRDMTSAAVNEIQVIYSDNEIILQ